MRNIQKELLQLGLSPSRISYWDMIFAVELVRADLSSLTALRKDVYCKIGARRAVEWDCAEASLRRGIRTIWSRGNRAQLERIMHYTLPEPPTVGEFLGAFAFYLDDVPEESA